jgi:hypothetical protein
MNHAKMTKAELLIEISLLEGKCKAYDNMIAKYRIEVDMLHDELDRHHDEKSKSPWWGIPALACAAAVLWVVVYFAWFR